MPILVHPLVVHFPVALWLTSALFDLLYLRRGERFYFRASQFLIGLGLLGALISIGAGFVDYVAVKPDDIGPAFINRHRVHSLIAYAATLIYGANFVARWRRPEMSRRWIMALLVIGAGLISYTGWLGGEIRLVM